MNSRTAVSIAALLSAATLTAQATNQQRMPPDYHGVQTRVPGIFVTPVPNAPFAATVEIISHQMLTDGTENIRTTSAHVARDSSGRIYNELRALVPVTFKGDPALLSAHIFDPATRLNIFLNPQTRLAREAILRPAAAARQMPTTPPIPGIGDPWGIMDGLRAPNPSNHAVAGIVEPGGPTSNPGAAIPLNKVNNQASAPLITQVDLGEQIIDGTVLRGTRKQQTLPAQLSGTGKPITITTEYWYSPVLAVYLIIRHQDPRTGEQIVAVKQIDRHEPSSTQFAVPANYKLVDETPPQ